MKFLNENGSPARVARRLARSRHGGFSYLELMVTITVFSLMSTMLLVNYNKINEKISLDTEAEKIGQAIREAQVFALSSRGRYRTGPADMIYPGYGIYFDATVQDSFVLFSDMNNTVPIGNKQYEPSGACGSDTSECLRVIPLGKSVTSFTLCGKITPLGGGATAGCPSGYKQSRYFAIIFQSPKTDAVIKGRPTAGAEENHNPAMITIRSRSGFTRSIYIYTTAQVVIR